MGTVDPVAFHDISAFVGSAGGDLECCGEIQRVGAVYPVFYFVIPR
jgi:hypothetical protein